MTTIEQKILETPLERRTEVLGLLKDSDFGEEFVKAFALKLEEAGYVPNLQGILAFWSDATFEHFTDFSLTYDYLLDLIVSFYHTYSMFQKHAKDTENPNVLNMLKWKKIQDNWSDLVVKTRADEETWNQVCEAVHTSMKSFDSALPSQLAAAETKVAAIDGVGVSGMYFTFKEGVIPGIVLKENEDLVKIEKDELFELILG